VDVACYALGHREQGDNDTELFTGAVDDNGLWLTGPGHICSTCLYYVTLEPDFPPGQELEEILISVRPPGTCSNSQA
jgi:hypothetical protein